MFEDHSDGSLAQEAGQHVEISLSVITKLMLYAGGTQHSGHSRHLGGLSMSSLSPSDETIGRN